MNNVHTKEILKKAYSEGGKNYVSYNNNFLILTKTKKTVEYIFNIVDTNGVIYYQIEQIALVD